MSEPSTTSEILSLVEREVLGRSEDAYSVERLSQLAASVDSAQYFAANMFRCTRSATKGDYLRKSIEACSVEGLALEFGVHKGGTINFIASQIKQTIFGFDVFFTGLPEDWQGMARAGHFRVAELPDVRPNVELVVGLFEDTLPTFVDTHPGPIRILHVDCDLYSSAKTIFKFAGHKIAKGTVIMFDEYFNYPGWRLHEFRAFQEFIEWAGLRYEYLCSVTSHQQVSVVITT